MSRMISTFQGRWFYRRQASSCIVEKIRQHRSVGTIRWSTSQTQEEFAESLGAFSKRLKSMWKIYKHGNWYHYQLKPRDVNSSLVSSCFEGKIKEFLHWIVTENKKWILHDNLKKNSAKPGESLPSPSIKPIIHGSKVNLCI